MQIAKLLGMKLDPEAVVVRRLEHARDLVGVKPIPSQKASTALARPASAAAGHHRFDRQPDIILAAVAELRRQRVERQKGAFDPHLLAVAERLGGAQHLQLAFDIEPVTRLDLDRRHALPRHRLRRGSDCSTSSSSVAARVARTVERMPPPARAISS